MTAFDPKRTFQVGIDWLRQAIALNHRGIRARTSMWVSLEPVAVRCLLCPISAYRHTTPASCTASRVVGEQQRAGRTFAGFYIGKVFRADQPSQCFPDGKYKRIGALPVAHRL